MNGNNIVVNIVEIDCRLSALDAAHLPNCFYRVDHF